MVFKLSLIIIKPYINYVIIMKISYLCLFLCTFATTATQAQPTTLDQYLIGKNILSSDYKIKNKKSLNEILKSISEEDSRVIPYQLDQNIMLEQLDIYADHIDMTGKITSPDFTQFIQQIGTTQFKEMMHKNLVQYCQQLFEHQFQRTNPYHVNIKLSTDSQSFPIKLQNTECKF